MKRFEKVLNYFVEKGYKFDNVRDDVMMFKDVKWNDYYELEGYRDICCVEVDYNYMNRKKYDVIVVRNKKVYGNNNLLKSIGWSVEHEIDSGLDDLINFYLNE